MMAWLLLAATILFEVAGTTLLKLSRGFSEIGPTIGAFTCYGLSLAGLNLTLKHIELSIAYAVWSGAGTALVATVGILWFREPVTALKIISLALIVFGVVGLQIASRET
jgi:small multidrug resistance pump